MCLNYVLMDKILKILRRDGIVGPGGWGHVWCAGVQILDTAFIFCPPQLPCATPNPSGTIFTGGRAGTLNYEKHPDSFFWSCLQMPVAAQTLSSPVWAADYSAAILTSGTTNDLTGQWLAGADDRRSGPALRTTF